MLKDLARPISVGALVLAGMGVAFAPTPAHAALGPNQDISVTNVEYACRAQNSIIDVSVGGPQTFRISAHSSVPSSVDPGDAVPSTSATLDLQMPYLLMDKIRGLGPKSIAGKADSDVTLEGVDADGTSVGAMNVAVKDLAASDQAIPATGPMTIAGVTGTVDPFTVPSFPGGDGLVYVELPLYFKLHAILTPPALHSIDKTDLDCYRTEASDSKRVIGTIAVGAGCSESDCALPSVDRSSVPAWVASTRPWADEPTTDPGDGSTGGNGTSGGQSGGSNSSGTGNGGGTSDDGNGGGNGGGKGHHHSGDSSTAGDGDGTYGGAATETAATTQLPDTGSPVKPWLLGVLGLALAARVALFARRRVARAGASRHGR